MTEGTVTGETVTGEAVAGRAVTGSTAAITVRHFAAAAEAAGADVETLAASSGGELHDLLVARHGEPMARVLARSSLLCAGRRLGREDPVPAGATVDVLPPFAGG